ncbi:hypothetical protein MKX01_025622 [Papaver californicum]|nr:hypothetical protein MKX01_025622 [Papaver californicum]
MCKLAYDLPIVTDVHESWQVNFVKLLERLLILSRFLLSYAVRFASFVMVLTEYCFSHSAKHWIRKLYLLNMKKCVARLRIHGLIMLTIQANNARLRPTTGKAPSQSQAAFLYVGLYAIAIGIGGIKSSLPAYGADQLGRSNKKLISSYFNWFFFSLCTGGLLSCTIMVWIEENKGWQWSFSISVVFLSLAILLFSSGYPIYIYRLPSGSPITRIFKVFFYAARNRKAQQLVVMNNQNELDNGSSYVKFRNQNFLGLLPIFASTIMMNCCLAQLQTFSVHQGVIMNRKIARGFELPPLSLSVFPLFFMLLSILVYGHLVLKLVKKKSSSTSPQETSIFPPLKRIVLGLALASASMAVAEIVKVKRRNYSVNDHVKLSIFWLGFQFLLLGVSDMCTLGGMMEFFYSEAPESMRSMCTTLDWCSTLMGYFISSILVSITNSVSRHAGNEWLDLFYTVLCVLNFLNFLNYMYWAKRRIIPCFFIILRWKLFLIVICEMLIHNF